MDGRAVQGVDHEDSNNSVGVDLVLRITGYTILCLELF